MGEHRLMREKLASAIGADLADRGKLLEAGFEALLAHFFPAGVGEQQRRDLRMTWFLACDHLFFGVMGVVSDGIGVTDRDIARMTGITDEIEQFKREALGASGPAPGRTQ